MRHLILLIALVLLLLYVLDSYFTHGAYFDMVRDSVQRIF